jgi:hypothetical protein
MQEIGLKLVISVLSSILCKGFISENFNREGKVRDESDLLHVYVRGAVMIDVFTCKILIGIPSYPWEFLDFSDLIIFSISLGVVYFSVMFEQGSFYEDCMGLL